MVYSNGDEEILATFYKDNQEDSRYFQMEFTGGYFFDQPETNPILYGIAKHQSGYYLQTRLSRPNPGTVYFCNTNRPEGQRETEDFRLRVVTGGTGTVRPGDDIRLRFGVSGYPGKFQVYRKCCYFPQYLDIKQKWYKIISDETNIYPYSTDFDCIKCLFAGTG